MESDFNVKIRKLKKLVTSLLSTTLDPSLSYHNLEHTLDVESVCKKIGKAEKINDNEMFVLQSAALLHDVGYTISYSNNEEHSIIIANKLLKNLCYSSIEIDKIRQLISVTRIPQRPTSLLEKIICDADLDYLGRNDYEQKAKLLFNELNTYLRISKEEWILKQIEFLKMHIFFTPFSKRNRMSIKMNNYLNLLNQLKK